MIIEREVETSYIYSPIIRSVTLPFLSINRLSTGLSIGQVAWGISGLIFVITMQPHKFPRSEYELAVGRWLLFVVVPFLVLIPFIYYFALHRFLARLASRVWECDSANIPKPGKIKTIRIDRIEQALQVGDDDSFDIGRGGVYCLRTSEDQYVFLSFHCSEIPVIREILEVNYAMPSHAVWDYRTEGKSIPVIRVGWDEVPDLDHWDYTVQIVSAQDLSAEFLNHFHRTDRHAG